MCENNNMLKPKFEDNPASYELFFKGTYDDETFSLIDKNGEVYVNFDHHYECETHEFDRIIQGIIDEYKSLNEANRKWHN